MKNCISFLLFPIIFSILSLSVFSQKRSEKRGVSYEIPYIEDLPVLSKGVSWFYNWGVTPGNSAVAAISDEYMDYVPMTWNNGYNRTNLRNYLTTHPKVKYILGFNEPNFTAQANMTPTQAAAAWPELEAIANEFNLKIVGPAVNYAPGGSGSVTENGVNYTDPWKYYDAFFAACTNCRVDYVAVHSYMNDPSAVVWYVNQFISKYNKPVWLTEFCAWEYKAPMTTSKTEGYAYQKDGMIRKIEQLELNPMVAKYAWFIPRTSNEIGFPYMQLLRNLQTDSAYEIVGKGVLTELGKIYVNMSSFDSTHYFGVNEQIPAKDYMQSFYVKLEASTDLASTIPIQVAGFEGGIFVDYFVDVPSAGVYPLSLRIATNAGVNPRFTISSNETELTTQEVSSTGGLTNWDIRTIQVTLAAGKQTIRISSNGISGCKMQWISFSPTAGNKAVENETVPVFVDKNDILQLSTIQNVSQLDVYDISGKLLLQQSASNQLSISSLEQGIYILKINLSNGKIISSKFIINKQIITI
jgi:hypothetical protein